MANFSLNKVFLLIVFLVLITVPQSKAALDSHYYDQTCPEAEKIILDTVQNASMHDPKVPARILRMFFHDYFVRVCHFPLLWSMSSYFSLKFCWVYEVCCNCRKINGDAIRDG